MDSAEALSLVGFYLGAFLAPLAASKLRVPAAVVEILYGLGAGASGLGLLQSTPFTGVLSQLGFLFLMFLVGMEIDFDRIEKEERASVLLAALIAGATLGLGLLITAERDWPPFFALILGAMSVGVLLVTIRETGASRNRFGQMLLLVGSLGELVTLLALTAFDLVHRFGIGAALLEEAAKSLLLFAAAYAFLSFLRLLVWWFPDPFERFLQSEDRSEVGVRAAFVVMLSLAALAASVGLEPILGAFLAGALFSFVFRKKGQLEAKLSAVGHGFFVPLFFVNVGLGLDASAIERPGSLMTLLGALAAASLLAKLLPSLLLLVAGFKLRQVVAGAFLLATPLTLLVAAAAMGERMGVLEKSTASAIVLLAIISGVIFPTIFKALSGEAGEVGGVTRDAEG